MTRIRLAHLSDPHLGPVPRPAALSLASKRVFGYINWLRTRRTSLAGALRTALEEDLAAAHPDHVCVTGDLVNIALEAEFLNAAGWLRKLGAPDAVTVVPGNHDAYVPGAAQRALAAWAPFASSDDGTPGFPVVRRRGPVAIIGVSTAVATPPLYATGRVGAAQRDALAAALDRHDDALKVVLIHHPPDPALAAGRRRLVDHDAVRTVLAEGCADVVLHGHTHEPSLATLATVRGTAHVIGVPSTYSDGTRHPPGGYSLLDIDLSAETLTLTRKGMADGGFSTVAVEKLPLVPPLR